MNIKTDGIWVWTKEAEKRAAELGLEERKENTPASLGYSLLGHYAPKVWVEKGFVKSRERGLLEMDNKNSLPEYCYGLLLISKRIILIKKGGKGYFETGCPEGATQEMVDKMNEELGVSKAQAEAMSVGSMFGWDVPGADPRCYEEISQ